MKLIQNVSLCAALMVAPVIHAQSSVATTAVLAADVEAAILAADEERMNATKSADSDKLNAILSDDLRYAHSNGSVDSKATLIAALVSRKSIYQSFDYKERKIVSAGPNAAVMSGRVLVGILSGEQRILLDLNYLAVWRQENGKWRFLAWQSCRNPAPQPAAAVTK
jgi:hypothetical protein